MSEQHPHTRTSPGQRRKLVIGTVVLVVGFFSPFTIPVVLNSGLSEVAKSVISGLLVFGIPEVAMLVAIAIMGKPGYQYIKGKLATYLKPLGPPDEVSPVRYKIGLLLFSTPLLLGFVLPYISLYFPQFAQLPLAFHIGMDMILIISFIVLGGDFWDKFRSLFHHDLKIAKS
jgi:hypothetical protein